MDTFVTNSASNNIWVLWNNVTTASTTIWVAWNTSCCTNIISTYNIGIITAINTTWSIWNTQIDHVQQHIEHKRPTEAEVQARLRQEQEYKKTEERQRKEQQKANDKAEVLLLANLSLQQREDLLKRNAFIVEVSGEKYEIRRGRSGNVRLLNRSGQPRRVFCIHPDINCPDADTMLAQKLLLESNHRRFYEIANITDYESDQRYFNSPTGIRLLEQMASRIEPGQA
jgi:hypothetical protein